MTGSPTVSGAYMQSGKLVHFWIKVAFTSISKWGSGAFSVTLPSGLPATSYYSFPSAALMNNSLTQLSQLTGIVIPGSTTMNLYYTYISFSQNFTQLNSFTATNPISLANADYLYISGSYITS
jgi:hypothetical protein